jgi:GDPmannose 4,6-dehydratase
MAALPFSQAVVIGADTPTGAYLARLLDARGVGVSGVMTGESADGGPLASLGIADAVVPVPAAKIAGLIAAVPGMAVFAVAGDMAIDAAIDAAADAAAEAPGRRFCQVVEIDLLRTSPALVARVQRLAALRRDTGAAFATALLHLHDSRLAPPDTLAGRITIAAFRAAQPLAAANILEVTETGPRDWGWTPEYVDAVIRVAALDRPVDVAVGSGTRLSVTGFAREAFGFFGLDAADHVRIEPQAAGIPAENPVDTARLKAVTGWQASTTGRDLVRALCEGAAGRA